MNKILLLFIVTSFCSVTMSLAQTDPIYSQYLNNPLLLNPAYSGLNKNFNASVTYRKQWAGFEGSPTTANASAHTSLLDNRMGVGMIILQDKMGNTKNTEVQATYAYRLDLDEKYLSFGLQAGFINFRSNNDELNPYDPADPAFSNNQNISKPSFGSGLILHSERYFIGLSVPRMLKMKADINNVETDLYRQHFYLMGAYTVFLTERIRFKPSVLLKTVKGSPLSADYNFSLNLDERYTAGIYTRNFNTYGLLAQAKFGGSYRFGYTFEVPTNQSVGARFTTHEFSLGLNLAIFDFHDSGITNY